MWWIFWSLLHLVQGRGQYFIREPKDMEAVMGRAVELECQVGNLAGPVQWSKDGFLLGYDPQIPGYPRYSMRNHGHIYNLRIEEVRLEDEAEFQCQVGPGPNEPPIRRKARLTVLVPPVSLTINQVPGRRALEVPEGQVVHLQCRAQSSKPATLLKWFRDNQELHAEEPKVSAEPGRKHSTDSAISLKATVAENGATYSCEAWHPALDSPLIAAVLISVLHPPEPPTIEGPDGGVPAGREVSLTCSSRGGNPRATLRWTRGGHQLAPAVTSTGLAFVSSVLRLTAVPSLHGAEFRCEAANSVAAARRTATYTLIVYFPPSKVTMSGPRSARAGAAVMLVCRTSGSSPASRLHWRLDDGTILRGESRVLGGEPGPWSSVSNLTLSRQDPGVHVIECIAETPSLPGRVTQSLSLTVNFPPGTPTILAPPLPLIVGQLARLKCVSQGGHPPPSLRWFKGEREIHAPVHATPSGVSSELVVRIEAEDNGATFRCEAYNEASREPAATFFHPAVHYPPSEIVLTRNPDGEVNEGEEIVLKCRVTSSVPPAAISWHSSKVHLPPAQPAGKLASTLSLRASPALHSAQVECRANHSQLQRDDDLSASTTLHVRFRPRFPLPHIRLTVVEGATPTIDFVASANPPSITYRWPSKRGLGKAPVNRHDTGRYTYRAENSLGFGTLDIDLDVLYPAEIVNVTGPTQVAEGEAVVLECLVDGNPTPNVSWCGPQHSFRYDGARLALANVSRALHSGQYSCEASNGVGTSAKTTYSLQVLDRPIFRETQNTVTARLGGAAELVCSVDFAGTEPVLSWLGPVNRTADIRVNRMGAVLESVLQIPAVRSEDLGPHTCLADGQPDGYVIQLRLEGVPEVPSNLTALNVTHESAILRWVAPWDGGHPATYRVRVAPENGDRVAHFIDVTEGRTWTRIERLRPASRYLVSLLAFNALGNGNYSPPILLVTSESPMMESSSSNWKWWLITAFPIGCVILFLNLLLVLMIRLRTCRSGSPRRQGTAAAPPEILLSEMKPYYQSYPVLESKWCVSFDQGRDQISKAEVPSTTST